MVIRTMRKIKIHQEDVEESATRSLTRFEVKARVRFMIMNNT
jgi:hypothetical protein